MLLIEEEECIYPVFYLFNNIYETGEISKDWLVSTLIPIPEQLLAKKFEDHRIISVESHVKTVYIINARIYLSSKYTKNNRHCDRDLRIIHNLNLQQKVKVQIENKFSEQFKIKRGVGQGSV